jgi:hypothetical protein
MEIDYNFAIVSSSRDIYLAVESRVNAVLEHLNNGTMGLSPAIGMAVHLHFLCCVVLCG